MYRKLYNVYNFWNNPQNYCNTDNKTACNTDAYGSCWYSNFRLGWEQLGGAVNVNCTDNGIIYTLTQDIAITSKFTSINCDDNTTFDGNGHTLTYSGSSEWPGLFKPRDNITFIVKNVTVVLKGPNLGIGAGAII